MSKSSRKSNEVEGIEKDSVVFRDGYSWLETERLKPNPWNPNEMDHSTLQMLKVNLQKEKYDPLIVVKARIFFGDTEQEKNDYIIVDGEQRWEAAKELGLAWLKVDIQLLKEAEAKAECYSRGKVRGQLDPLKEGFLFNLEVEALGSEAATAEKYKVSRSYVAGRRTLVRAPMVIRNLLRYPDKTYKKVVEKAHVAEVKEAKAHVKEIQKDKEAGPWAVQNAQNRIPDKLDEEDLVPRGTLTASHVEALAALPEEEAIILATRVMDRDLSVRETERQAKNRKETLDTEERFRKALEVAKSPKCPECGSDPRDFGNTETVFRCDESPYGHSHWDYTKTPEQHRKKKERSQVKEKKERSAQLSAAKQNPAYIRRAEDVNDLYESMRPWVLRKIQQFEKITRVSITGVRADGKVMRIDYPSGYGLSLYFQTSEGTEDGTLASMSTKGFSFTMEKKEYKKLPFNTKLNCTATPEYRASVQHFLDTIINTDLDPGLPEDPDQVRNILRHYGEAEPEPTVDVCPICEKSEGECTCLAIEKGAYVYSDEKAEK